MAFTAMEALENVEKKMLLGGSFLGVDMGSYSAKIVQLAIKDGVVTLETYGEILNSIYADSQVGRAVRPKPYNASSELSDIVHEVRADARRCGMAVPLSETFFNTVDLPKRDPEQMALIVPQEAKQFIPMPIEKVMLDWYALPDGGEASAFDVMKGHTQTEAQKQKVMLVAVKKETASALSDITDNSRLTPEFFEIEMFSLVRACTHDIDTPVLVLDFGASATKAYVVNEERITLAAHIIPVGGQVLTEAVMGVMTCNFPAAEKAKCEQGLTGGGQESAAINAALAPLWTYIAQVLLEHTNRGGKTVPRVVLTGGGSYMSGLPELVANTLQLPTDKVNAFARTKGPMILENALKEDGPRYAVAVGLALRGVGK